MTNKALITPNVFKWARESARITQETAAAKVSVTIDRLKNWEEGISLPTIKQAKTLAKAYKRPFALFFLPEIPQDFQPLQDFRKSGAKPLSTSSIFIIREIQQKQAWISDFYAENQENKLPFVGRFSVKNKPQQVAQDILTSLKMNPPAYQTNNPIKEWINAAETNGIFISKTSFIQAGLKLDLEELQGFAIADAYAPFVFINSNDWNSSQLFTLVHELAHIWIAQTGLSNQIESELEHKDKFHPVELFCNEVTANVLMPKEFFLKLDSLLFQDFQEIVKIAKQLGVSSYALLVRALNLKVITHTVYQQVKNQLDNNYNTHLQKAKQTQQNKQGKPNYFLLQLNRNSKLFTQTILDAFRGGLIEPTMASNLLNVKVNKFSKLESILYR